MDKKACELIITALSDCSEPIDRKELMLKTGIIETEEFNSAVSYLDSQGKIVVIRRKKVSLPEKAGYAVGTVVRLSKGFLFVHPENEETDDIYIHSSHSKGAMPGDRVLVRDITLEEKGPSGKIDKILEKGARVVTGTVERTGGKKGKTFLLPDGGISYSIPVIKGGELKSRNGDKVKASISFDQKEKRIYARVIHIYGNAGSAKICADAIIDANGIPVKFPVAVKHEAAMKAAEPITAEEINRRLDLRDELIFTIDGADAKDLDDAISVKKLDKGWELGVHIADVSHFVTTGSKLDEEAQKRGTSVYFADRVIPMLPVELSNGCCSLNPDENKLTFSAIMKLDEKGSLVDYRFEKTVISSKVRGVYSEINSLFDGTADDRIKQKYDIISDELQDARELASILSAKAKKRGELDIESEELRFVLDPQGVCIGVSPRDRGESEEMIEQFMIQANEAAALYAKSAGIPFVYRVHEPPEPERLCNLSSLASACGFDNRRIKEGVHQTDLAALIDSAKQTKYSRLISSQVLRTMSKARYDHRPIGHFGLSLADYCHFTSPIRRYPDTSIHRILTDLISGVPIDSIKQRYDEFAKKSSALSSEFELRAVRAERDTEKCYAAEYMTSHIGEIHDGIVSGITNRGIFIAIENGIEGFVDLTDDDRAYFEYDGLTATRDKKSGKSFTIGDSVKIKVKSATVATGEIDFSLLK